MVHTHSDHVHQHPPRTLKSINTAFYIGIALNATFTLLEFSIGYSGNSLALIADATHNLSDSISLVIALLGLKLAQKVASSVYTYGYKKASIFASFINAGLIVYISFDIGIEALKRFSEPPEIIGGTVILTALIGILINTISATLFFKGQKTDINIKGAFLHLLLDALVSTGVVFSGLIIYYTGWNIVDPIVSVVIAITLLVSTWTLLKESIKLSMDGIPEGVNVQQIEMILRNSNEVKDFHHLHIWGLSSSQNALTVHIRLIVDTDIESLMQIKQKIKKDLKSANIQHATIEFDSLTNQYCE